MPVVLGVMYLASLGAMAVVVTALGDPAPGGEAVLAAILAGLAGIAALGAFYRALAIGTMSIVAPVASTGVALPGGRGAARRATIPASRARRAW